MRNHIYYSFVSVRGWGRRAVSRSLQILSPLGLVLAGLALLAGGCGSPSGGSCAAGSGCVTLALSAAGLAAAGDSLTLDDLELIIRVGETTRRVRFDDRVLRPPTELPLLLPELAADAEQRIAIYARAHINIGSSGSQELTAAIIRPAGQALAASYPLVLSRACVAAPCAIPEPRRGAALALDPHSRHLVLFGGRRQDGTPLADTWEWDGLGWQQAAVASAPPARAGHGLALDVRRGNLLLFGGAGGPEAAPQLFADTWEYRGAAAGWSQIASGGPPARQQAAMAGAALDRGSGSIGLLLHGGVDAGGATLGDTWLWDGQTWTAPPLASDPCPAAPPLTATLPRCRSQAALIPAAAPSQPALLVGGLLGPAGSLQSAETDNSVWQWEGAAWSPAAVYRPPTVLLRYGHFAGSAAAASGGLALVAFGDSASGLRQDSFLLDLKTGQFAPQLGPAPPPRSEAAVAYDEERDEVFLFGGRGKSGLLGDAFSFTPVAGWRVHQ